MRTLVLNAGYEPLAVVSFKRALLLVMNQKATVLVHEEGNPVCAASGSWQRPSVILLTRYVRAPRAHRIPVTRRQWLDGTAVGHVRQCVLHSAWAGD